MTEEQNAQRAEAIGAVMTESGLTLAVAESLTGGQISASLAAASDAGTWFRGGIVAYAEGVKRNLLSVPDCPVVSEECVKHLAVNAARLLDADYAVAVTGEAGPESQEDVPPGTVWLGVSGPNGTWMRLARFDGEPEKIVDQTIAAALELLLEYATSSLQEQ